MEALLNPAMWIALLEIIWVNILLSGDNAVVIALAARNLPAHQQNRAVLFGSGAAIVLRVVLTLFAVALLQFPYLKLVGSLLLLWIAVQLLADKGDEGEVKASASLWHAVRTILIADLVMSLDNVIAVAGAANTAPVEMRTPLLVAGLALSIPLIIFGSTLLLKVMERFAMPYGVEAIGAAARAWDPNQQKAVFIYGGNWLADPVSPAGLSASGLYGTSSNQQMLTESGAQQLQPDDVVFFRPRQSEAVLQQFGDIAVFDGGKITDMWPVFPATG